MTSHQIFKSAPSKHRMSILAISVFAALSLPQMTYAENLDHHIITRQPIGVWEQRFPDRIVSEFNKPDEDLEISWTLQDEKDFGDGSPVRAGNITAKNIKVRADFNGNFWTNRAVLSDKKGELTHLRASEKIDVLATHDAFCTMAGGTIKVDGFKELKAESTGAMGWAVIDNAYAQNGVVSPGGIEMIADPNQVNTIITLISQNNSGTEKGTKPEQTGGTVGGGVEGDAMATSIKLQADTIYIENKNTADDASAIHVDNTLNDVFTTTANAKDLTIKGTTAVLQSRNTQVDLNRTSQGKLTLTGKINVSQGTLNATMGGEGSTLTGATEVKDKGTINVKAVGTNAKVEGDITATQGGKAELNFSGDGATLTGKLSALAPTGNTNRVMFMAAPPAPGADTGNNQPSDADASDTIIVANFTGADAEFNGQFVSETDTVVTASFTGANSTVTADGDKLAENKGGKLNLTFSNKAKVKGNVSADAGESNIKLLDASTWDGTLTGNAKAELSNKALWNVTGDSNLALLSMKDESGVSLVGTAQKLTTDELNGSGLVLLDLKYQDDEVATYRDGTASDYLIVKQGGDGGTQTVLATKDSDLTGLTEGKKLYFATVATGSTSFETGDASKVTVFQRDKLYDQIINYKAESETDATDGEFKGFDNWYLTLAPSKNPDEDKVINDNGKITSPAFSSALAIWRDEDTLAKRLGELRYSASDLSGTWARLTASKAKRDNGAQSFENKLDSVQIGFDRKIASDQRSDWYLGAAYSYLWGDSDYEQGDADVKGHVLTLYATNLRSSGVYGDIVGRIGKLNTEYTAYYGDKGEFDNWAASLGVELGHKFKFGASQNWMLEPQVQLTYHYVKGDDYTSKNGIRVEQDNADSLVARVGVLAAREFTGNTVTNGRVYAKASVLHDFLGDTAVTATQDVAYHAEDDLGDTWGVLGLGTNLQFGKSTHMYFDVETGVSADVKTKFNLNFGLRYTF